jgi:AbrB family looped-hinge helix DNA binding protein
MRFVKRINERGTTTLPNEVREALSIKEGDIVEFEVLNVVHKDSPSDEGNIASPASKSEVNA